MNFDDHIPGARHEELEMNIYIKHRTPGATQVTEWTDVCHSHDPFVWIDHNELRPTSRWQAVPRKKKFCMTVYTPSRRIGLHTSLRSYHQTLEFAIKAGEMWLKVTHENLANRRAR